MIAPSSSRLWQYAVGPDFAKVADSALWTAVQLATFDTSGGEQTFAAWATDGSCKILKPPLWIEVALSDMTALVCNMAKRHTKIDNDLVLRHHLNQPISGEHT
jgi:hypothetical protein